MREHAEVVEITDLLPTKMRAAWPGGMRIIVRREHPHPGAQLSLFEERDGWRYQAFVTNTQQGAGRLPRRQAPRPRPRRRPDPHRERHRPGTVSLPRVLDQLRLAGRRDPAPDLTAWLRMLALVQALKACEPKALGYRFLQIPARLTHGARRRHRRLPKTWPWVKAEAATFTAVLAIPMRT